MSPSVMRQRQLIWDIQEILFPGDISPWLCYNYKLYFETGELIHIILGDIKCEGCQTHFCLCN